MRADTDQKSWSLVSSLLPGSSGSSARHRKKKSTIVCSWWKRSDFLRQKERRRDEPHSMVKVLEEVIEKIPSLSSSSSSPSILDEHDLGAERRDAPPQPVTTTDTTTTTTIISTTSLDPPASASEENDGFGKNRLPSWSNLDYIEAEDTFDDFIEVVGDDSSAAKATARKSSGKCVWCSKNQCFRTFVIEDDSSSVVDPLSCREKILQPALGCDELATESCIDSSHCSWLCTYWDDDV